MLYMDELCNSGTSVGSKDGKWYPAIPMPYFGWFGPYGTWRDAWAVLNSKAQAIQQTRMPLPAAPVGRTEEKADAPLS